MQNTTNFQPDVLGHVGWKYYNTIKKKAMEQEFSWSGLIISLVIAFFVVLISAQALNLAYKSISATKNHENFLEQKIYRLENVKHINIQALKSTKYLELKSIKPAV
jgi:hypothetical protein